MIRVKINRKKRICKTEKFKFFKVPYWPEYETPPPPFFSRCTFWKKAFWKPNLVFYQKKKNILFLKYFDISLFFLFFVFFFKA